MYVVLPLTREWIEIFAYRRNTSLWAVLPLTREWIEIAQAAVKFMTVFRSPSYEGVD